MVLPSLRQRSRPRRAGNPARCYATGFAASSPLRAALTAALGSNAPGAEKPIRSPRPENRDRGGLADDRTPMIARGGDRSWRVCALLVLAIMALQALGLAIEGHPAICKCGYVKLWEGAVNSAGNSQH